MAKYLFFLIVGIWSSIGIAQNLPVVNYSQRTSNFDAQLPIGKRFQIKGAVQPEIVEVVVESFGYGTDIPDELKNQKEEERSNYCKLDCGGAATSVATISTIIQRSI